MSAATKAPERQRLDKWLWCARMVRTRRDAAALTTAGFVRLNGKRTIAASHPVRIGDVVTLALDRSVRVVRVEGLCERRGGATDARLLYRNLATGSGTKACTFSGNVRKISARIDGAGAACSLSNGTLGSVQK